MAILSGPEIVRQRSLGAIVLDPFDPQLVNPNSVNLTLAEQLLAYDTSSTLDPKEEPATTPITIPAHGYILHPGRLYLASTVERIGGIGFVPVINGRSSLGRLGLLVHQTAGFCDDGWIGEVTLELSTLHPLRIYAGMRVCQVAFHVLVGERQPYQGKYQGSRGPVASRLWQEMGHAASKASVS